MKIYLFVRFKGVFPKVKVKFWTTCCDFQVSKVQIFWEVHKIWKNLPLKIWRYWAVSNFKWKIFSNFVTFSEYPNFTGKYVSEALILESVNPQYDERLFIEFPKKYKNKKQFLYSTCSKFVFFGEFNEQSLVILWVNWCKNEGFWKRLTCTGIVADNKPLLDFIKIILTSSIAKSH